MNATKAKPTKKQSIKLHQPGLFDEQDTEKPANKTTARVAERKKAKNNAQTRAKKRKTQPTTQCRTKKPETLKFPTLQEAIDRWDDVTGVAPECEIMPMNSEAKTRGLCESIRAARQTNPIHLDEEGRLLNGRHRLIACSALGIEPEFKIVDPANPLLHVLADSNQREYNVATRASIALKVEAFLKQRCKELKDQTGRDILAGRRVQKERSIDTGGKEPTTMHAGEKLRDTAIRMAGSTLSAVRRLTIVMNKDPDLAERAITGEITLKDAENQLTQNQEESGSDQPSRNIPTAQYGTSDAPDPTLRDETDNLSSKESDGPKTRVANATPKQGASTPPAAKPMKVTTTEERQLQDGKMEYWRGSRSAILIPEREMGGVSKIRIILDSGDELKFLGVKTLSHGRRLINRFLDQDRLAS